MNTTTHAAASSAALELMEDAAPVLSPATPLPLAPSTVRADVDLVERLRKLREEGIKGRKYSNSQLADAIGCNPANISIYLNQLRADAPVIKFALPAFESKVREFLYTLSTRRHFDGGTIETAVVTRFRAFVEMVRSTGEIGVYYGAAGIGKTTGAQAYSAQFPNAKYIPATSWCRGARDIEQAVKAAMGVTEKGQAGRAQLVAKLKAFEGALLVDNCHRLTLGAIKLLFDLYDLTGTPMILVGNPSFLTKLKPDANDPADERDQLYSRILLKQEAKFPTGEGEGNAALYKAADALLKREAPDHVADLRKMARQVALQPGHLRAMVKRIRLALEYASLPNFAGRPITDAFKSAHSTSVHSGYDLED